MKSFACFFNLEPRFTVHGRCYRILNVIGQGGQATVYRCEDQRAAKYAVKVFYFSRFPSREMRHRIRNFKKEARILKYLGKRSPHFVKLIDHEYKPKENIGYMIMELGDGSFRRQLLGIPLNDSLRRVYWKQIVAILKDLQDARVGN